MQTFEEMVTQFTPSEVEAALHVNDHMVEVAYVAMVRAMATDEEAAKIGQSPEAIKAEIVEVQEVIAYLQAVHYRLFHTKFKESVEETE